MPGRACGFESRHRYKLTIDQPLEKWYDMSMKKMTGNETNVFARAYIRDRDLVYHKDAMLIALLAHTHGDDRDGPDGRRVRQMLDDINLA